MLIIRIYKQIVRQVFARLRVLLCFSFTDTSGKNNETGIYCMMKQTMSMSSLCLLFTCEKRLALLGKNNFEIYSLPAGAPFPDRKA